MCLRGGMAYTLGLEPSGSNPLGVQIPPQVPKFRGLTQSSRVHALGA